MLSSVKPIMMKEVSDKSNESTINSNISKPHLWDDFNFSTDESESNDAKSSSSREAKITNKRERRLLQNRQSASRLRIKKKETMSKLAKEREFLKAENTTLQQKVSLSLKFHWLLKFSKTSVNYSIGWWVPNWTFWVLAREHPAQEEDWRNPEEAESIASNLPQGNRRG